MDLNEGKLQKLKPRVWELPQEHPSQQWGERKCRHTQFGHTLAYLGELTTYCLTPTHADKPSDCEQQTATIPTSQLIF